jgi:tRNA-uridine 2-sulfurtransferase
MPEQPDVMVAMSGGVDSSVVAALLLEKGYRVTGVMLRLWSEPDTPRQNACCTPEAVSEARIVADQLGFPFHEFDAVDAFRERIVQYFLDEMAFGRTPNPCPVCNPQIKWNLLLGESQKLGVNFLATGHYARLRHAADGKIEMLCALDHSKDQSYALHGLTQIQLEHTFFPLGEFKKTEVREMARKRNLRVAERPESQDLCFVSSSNYPEFLKKYIPQGQQPGDILNHQGKILGKHQGLSLYTIGQRKGLQIAAPRPLYVIAKDVQKNTLIVGFEEELGQSELTASQVNWISGKSPDAPQEVLVKIRYKAEFAPGLLTPRPDSKIHIRFDHPLRDITPGQFAVIYDSDRVLGGGMIDNPIKSD